MLLESEIWSGEKVRKCKEYRKLSLSKKFPQRAGVISCITPSTGKSLHVALFLRLKFLILYPAYQSWLAEKAKVEIIKDLFQYSNWSHFESTGSRSPIDSFYQRNTIFGVLNLAVKIKNLFPSKCWSGENTESFDWWEFLQIFKNIYHWKYRWTVSITIARFSSAFADCFSENQFFRSSSFRMNFLKVLKITNSWNQLFSFLRNQKQFPQNWGLISILHDFHRRFSTSTTLIMRYLRNFFLRSGMLIDQKCKRRRLVKFIRVIQSHLFANVSETWSVYLTMRANIQLFWIFEFAWKSFCLIPTKLSQLTDSNFGKFLNSNFVQFQRLLGCWVTKMDKKTAISVVRSGVSRQLK